MSLIERFFMIVGIVWTLQWAFTRILYALVPDEEPNTDLDSEWRQ